MPMLVLVLVWVQTESLWPFTHPGLLGHIFDGRNCRSQGMVSTHAKGSV